jgi:hypothetical protein
LVHVVGHVDDVLMVEVESWESWSVRYIRNFRMNLVVMVHYEGVQLLTLNYFSIVNCSIEDAAVSLVVVLVFRHCP